MRTKDLITRFCSLTNEGLANRIDNIEATYDVVKDEIANQSDEERPLLLETFDEMVRCYQHAKQPSEFFHVTVTDVGPRFDQCYYLLREFLDKAVVGLKENFAESLVRTSGTVGMHPYILIGRFWQVSGLQKYAPSGHLEHFDYEPLLLTDGIVSTVSGDYLSMESVSRSGQGIGALGQMVTRPKFRGGGHGSALNQAFEATVHQIAASHGETVQLFLLEAKDNARAFWFRQGYRYPLGSQYIQPAIAYDPVTGEDLFSEMTETIMIKPCQEQDNSSINVSLLMDAMRTMYEGWYIPHYLSESGRKRVTAHIYTLLSDFEASLTKENGRVPLVGPTRNI
jgi:GNAT superfamily N-acetyltransferase